jgi:hypothetical protein
MVPKLKDRLLSLSSGETDMRGTILEISFFSAKNKGEVKPFALEHLNNLRLTWGGEALGSGWGAELFLRANDAPGNESTLEHLFTFRLSSEAREGIDTGCVIEILEGENVGVPGREEVGEDGGDDVGEDVGEDKGEVGNGR